MKEIKQYRIAVSVHGTLSKLSDTGAGIWYVAETTKDKAIATLRDYLKQHNLFGSIQSGFVPSEVPVPMERGQVLSEKEYSYLLEEQKAQKSYKFIPHKNTREPNLGIDVDKSAVQGAYGNKNEPTYIEDCGDLPHVDGVTYEGRNLDKYNLESQIDEIEL